MLARFFSGLWAAIKPKERSLYWHQGNEAYHAGNNVESCPHESWRRDEWLDGFYGR